MSSAAAAGRRGGGSRTKHQVDDRATLAWTALVELATSGSDTARARASVELLDRLEPLLGGSKAAAVKLAKRIKRR